MPPRLTSPGRGCRYAVGVFALALGLMGAFPFPARGQDATNYIEFSNLLPAPGSIQANSKQRQAAQRQDMYRRRVVISDAMSPFVPRDARISLINGGKFSPQAHPEANNPAGRFFNLFFFTAVVALTGGLLARRFVPQLLTDLNQRLNPWAAAPPAGARNYPEFVRSEEQPFGAFVAAMRAGPTATTATTTAAPVEGLREFHVQAKKRLAEQRRQLQEINGEASDAARKKLLVNLYFDLGVLKDSAKLPEVLPFWQLASALEGLLKELSKRIRSGTPSTLRSIQSGLEVLENLCIAGVKPDLLSGRPLQFLIVDDDLVSRQAMALSLKKAFSQPDLAIDSISALALTDKQAYDVIFLDVQMPGMDGFELCQKVHSSSLNRSTPVVFVTSGSDFDARVKSTLIGGNDLLGKPFLIFEITVKALTLALHGRLQSQHLTPPPTAPVKDTPARAAEIPGQAPSSAHAIHRRSAPALNNAHGTSPTGQINEAENAQAAEQAFLNRAAGNLGPLRELCEILAGTPDPVRRQNLLADGFLRLNSLLSAQEVIHPAYQLSHALENLIRKLLQNVAHTTPSALATITMAMDLLNDLCLPGLNADLAVNPPIRLLVVDDDLVARRALVMALQNAFQKPESAESGEVALEQARAEQFDVIFLDLQMPGMDGFETCGNIRLTELNSDTPIVFVTGQADYAARAKASRDTGNDLVSKPFLTAEINVKALAFALRGRLRRPALESSNALTPPAP